MTDHKYIPGSGPYEPKLMILGDCPTSKDVSVEKLFTGNEGKLLDQVLHDAGINRHNCWLTTVSKYHVPFHKKIPFAIRAKNIGIDIPQQLADLQEEINAVKPNCILALGSTALWALSGKTKIESFRGSILHGMGTKFVPTYNPAQLSWQTEGIEFKGYWNRQIMIVDAKRALAESESPVLDLPSRIVEICRNSAHLAEFINRYKDSRKMSVDIEANGTCMPVCIGLAFNKSHSMVIPLWNIQGISHIPDSDMVQIWLMLSELLWEKDIIGQNFNYDRDKIKRLGFIIRKLIDDTMLKGHAINPELPKRLGFFTSIYTREPFYKDEGMYEGSIEDLYKGCGKDACVTFEINDAMDADLDELGMRSYYRNFLLRLPEMYLDIENRGFRVDSEERDKLLHKYVEWDERLRYELFHLVGAEINVNSHKQVASLLFDNLKLPQREGTGEEEITALLNSQGIWAKRDESHRRICELILEDRRVRKSISTYLMALPDYDGRMRSTYFLCLDTGRTSTGQQDPPIRPSVEVIDETGKKKQKVLGIAFQTMTKHGDIGSDIRGMYVPDNFHFETIENELVKIEEEEEFVQADSSQAEARVVWLLAEDEEALKLVDEIDYHAHTAVWFFGPNEELQNYDKKKLGYEHPIRFCGKTLRHAGHLGAGKRRAAITVNTDARKYKIPISITEAIAERALQIFHIKQPRIQQIFQAQVIEALKRSRQLVAPLPYGIKAVMGGKRTFFERMGEELFRQGLSYIPQRAVSDNTKAAGLRIREHIPGIKIVMESHDSLLFSIPISKKQLWVPIIKEEMERPIDFSKCTLPRRELSIPCEIEFGKNYRDLKKFKFKDIGLIEPPSIIPSIPPKSITEQFLVSELPPDTFMDDKVYYHTVEKKMIREELNNGRNDDDIPF